LDSWAAAENPGLKETKAHNPSPFPRKIVLSFSWISFYFQPSVFLVRFESILSPGLSLLQNSGVTSGVWVGGIGISGVGGGHGGGISGSNRSGIGSGDWSGIGSGNGSGIGGSNNWSSSYAVEVASHVLGTGGGDHSSRSSNHRGRGQDSWLGLSHGGGHQSAQDNEGGLQEK